MPRLPLNTLPTFRAVAAVNNLRAAAETLHLTHSAVSQQISLLEEQLGFQLFDRQGRRMRLNSAGAALLRVVEPVLAQLDQGVRDAQSAANNVGHQLRISVLPSFAQRWLLPRMSSWRAQHPDIAIELHSSQQVMDLQRDGFHAALRQGKGTWRGLDATCLIDSPSVPLCAPQTARRLMGCDSAALAHEPLLGDGPRWERWFALAGHPCHITPVAVFNDAGLMMQAAEQDLGIALGRELIAADALRDGRLVRLSSLALTDSNSDSYWLVHPPELKDWPPLVALRQWLQDELARSKAHLNGALPALPRPAKAAKRSSVRGRTT